MKILFLGYNESETCLIKFLRDHDYNIVQRKDKITPEESKNFDFIISYGYKHIIKEDVISQFKNKIINLHISYLPYNRGTNPNFWSFYESTPAGVTIHILDRGIDTGDILVQKKIIFEESENTFRKTYNRLRNEIENLFKENYQALLHCNIIPKKQEGIGTYHKLVDLPSNIKNWDINIKEYLNNMKNNETDLEIINDIEAARTKNNVNWMDILRIAVTHAPTETKKLITKINEQDNNISALLDKLSKN